MIESIRDDLKRVLQDLVISNAEESLRAFALRSLERLRNEYENESGESLRPPVSRRTLVDLASLRRASVQKHDALAKTTRGLLWPRKGGFVVQFAAGRSPYETKFTIGHELGHTLFYDLAKERPEDLLRTGCASSVSAGVIEAVCDLFASELLVPSDFLIQDAQELKEEVEASFLQTVIKLARRYMVSVDVMARQMIRVVEDRGDVVWIRWEEDREKPSRWTGTPPSLRLKDFVVSKRSDPFLPLRSEARPGSVTDSAYRGENAEGIEEVSIGGLEAVCVVEAKRTARGSQLVVFSAMRVIQAREELKHTVPVKFGRRDGEGDRAKVPNREDSP